jgi:type I restriction enzyme S subunit
MAPAGSLFVVVRGMILARDLPVSMAMVPMAFNQDMKAILPNGTVDTEYLLYAFAAHKNRLRKEIGTSAHGTRRISTSAIEDFQVPLPPRDEQRAIAALLAIVEDARNATENVISAARQLKLSLMRHLFTYGPVQVVEADRVALKETDVCRCPSYWTTEQLSKIALIERGKFMHRPRNDPRYYGGSIPFIQTGDVTRCDGRIRTYSQTLNELGLSVSRIFPKGTIVLTIAANIGDSAILEFDSAFPDSLVGITPAPDVSNEYLAYYLQTQKHEMDRLAPRGTQKNINIRFLEPWPVVVPPAEEQKSIASSLSAIDSKIEKETHRREALDGLFHSLLHHLMSGKVRVNHLDFSTSAEVAPCQ